MADGSTILIGGFGDAGAPTNLVLALARQGAQELTIVINAMHRAGVELLCRRRQVRHAVTSFPIRHSSAYRTAFEQLLRAGEATAETVPQGTMIERIRAAGAGIPAFYTPTGIDTLLERDRERRTINGKAYLLEYALPGDYTLIRAHKADRLGNLVYHGAARNFNPVMATGSRITVVEVDEIVEVGTLDPEAIVTPHVYVDRIVQVPPWRGPYLDEQ